MKKMSRSRKSVAKCANSLPVKLQTSSSSKCSGNGEKYPSFVSDCSSCQPRTAVDTDCENGLQQFINSSVQIAKSRRVRDANKIAVRGIECATVILHNIEWMVREQNQGYETSSQLDKHLEEAESKNVKLKTDIANLLESNVRMKDENQQILNEHNCEHQKLLTIEQENDMLRNTIESLPPKIQEELQKIADASMRLEGDLIRRGTQWENSNFILQDRLAQLQYDHETLKTDYQAVRDVLRADCGGDVMDVDEPFNVQADHEAEIQMVKHDHRCLISELNKLNYKLWTEKFFARGRLDEQIKKKEYYKKLMERLERENTAYRKEISSLDKEIEASLDVICSKMKNKCKEKSLNDASVCLNA